MYSHSTIIYSTFFFLSIQFSLRLLSLSHSISLSISPIYFNWNFPKWILCSLIWFVIFIFISNNFMPTQMRTYFGWTKLNLFQMEKNWFNIQFLLINLFSSVPTNRQIYSNIVNSVQILPFKPSIHYFYVIFNFCNCSHSRLKWKLHYHTIVNKWRKSAQHSIKV